MGRIPDDWDGETFSPGYGPADPPTRRIKPPLPQTDLRLARPPGTLLDLERVENAMFSDIPDGTSGPD
ncbi:hypothetical protein EDM68_04585 [Candidatus Uhrbacteria bacterium]|nr:MAG: hypothetical protein EDM68_04585 [Candidatus Uhrbacteria bacterium]